MLFKLPSCKRVFVLKGKRGYLIQDTFNEIDRTKDLYLATLYTSFEGAERERVFLHLYDPDLEVIGCDISIRRSTILNEQSIHPIL